MPKERVTAEQTEVLCSFFEDNPEVLRGYKKTPQCKDAVQKKWMQITPQLNSLGPQRDSKSWAKYLCTLKAKLKKKQVKWKQKSDGTGPIIGNADDFSEIALRMFQVLRQDTQAQQESHDSASDLEMEDVTQEDNPTLKEDIKHEIDPKAEQNEDVKWLKEELVDLNHTPVYIKLSDTTPPAVQSVQTSKVINKKGDDEFASFGQNVAQQLRTLPLAVALETQEMLLSVLRKQRLKNISNPKDPLDI